MKKKAPPTFQTYARDFLSDTMGLSLAASGAHARLRAWSWEHGPVPRDPAVRARLIGGSATRAAGVWTEIVHLWVDTEHGFVDAQLEEQRVDQHDFIVEQTRKARLGAEALWAKRRAEQAARGDARTMPAGMPAAVPQELPELCPDDAPALCTLHSADLDQNQKEQRRSRVAPPADSPQVLLKIAHTVLDDVEAQALDPKSAVEEIKCRAAKAQLQYDGDRVRKAVESAMYQRTRQHR